MRLSTEFYVCSGDLSAHLEAFSLYLMVIIRLREWALDVAVSEFEDWALSVHDERRDMVTHMAWDERGWPYNSR